MNAVLKLREARQELVDCERCPLHAEANKLVFGSGPPNAKIFLVGEAPGADEDKLGVPFVGPAGKCLNGLLHKAGIRRDACYVTNIVKHRPPWNRDPEPKEVEACMPFLRRQIKAIHPKVIVLLGGAATTALLSLPISAARNRSFWIDGVRTIATWHPAYVLRSPGSAADVIKDLARVKAAAEK